MRIDNVKLISPFHLKFIRLDWEPGRVLMVLSMGMCEIKWVFPGGTVPCNRYGNLCQAGALWIFGAANPIGSRQQEVVGIRSTLMGSTSLKFNKCKSRSSVAEYGLCMQKVPGSKPGISSWAGRNSGEPPILS